MSEIPELDWANRNGARVTRDGADGSESLAQNEVIAEEFAALFPEFAARSASPEAVWERMRHSEVPLPAALCLSGGGIRSATFCLGVLQGLSDQDLLERFNYLSTVSGGGYIGGWLSRWRTGDAPTLGAGRLAGTPADALRESPDDGVPPPNHPIRRLRAFSNYLSPSWGLSLDSLTLFTIFFRNLLFNQLVWAPLLLLAPLLPRLAVAGWLWAGGWTIPVGALRGDPVAAAMLVPTALVGLFWLLCGLAVLFGASIWKEEQREWISRLAALPLLFAIAWLGLFVLFVYLPLLLLHVPLVTQSAGKSGAIAVLTAFVTGLLGYWSRYGPDLRRKAFGLANQLGARLLDLLAAATLLMLCLAAALTDRYLLGRPALKTLLSHADFYRSVSHPANVPLLILFALLVGLTLFFAAFVGVNRFSLHAIYGNRLVRAYLGTARAERAPSKLTDFDAADNVAISDLPSGDNRTTTLFHVVNTTLNLTKKKSRRLDWQERKGASFTITPLHCGAPSVGYRRSPDFGGPWGMTLGRALTISGAAATPNMGYHSSPLMALVLTLFNIRLGWWVPNPRKDPSRKGSEPLLGLRYALKEAFSGTNDESGWLYLSDGGHFDNLGLYEMVRRRCRRIVVVDAGCDGEFRHGDLLAAVRLIEVDFAIPIVLPANLPGQDGPAKATRITKGVIRYSALPDHHPDGELYVIKPILNGSEPPGLRAYAEVSRKGGKTFPHHSTADQFFNETQFESYRRLGQHSVTDLLAAMTGSAAPPPSPPSTASVPAAAPPPEASRNGLKGLGSGLSTLSPAQFLTGAITAFATAGVVTSVSHSVTDRVVPLIIGVSPTVTGELRIDADDRQRLDSGVTIRSDAEALALVQLLTSQLQVLIDRPATPDLQPITAQIEQLRVALVTYLGRPQRPAPRFTFDQTNLSNALTELHGLRSDLSAREPVNLKKLEQILDALKDVSANVQSSGPRRNVRGQ